MSQDEPGTLDQLAERIVSCRRCPRLVSWREKVAREKRASFSDQDYWGRPVSGFGDPRAGLLVVGLAPAAHGANRTGRIFTGDRSGDWLFRALHRAGFANQARSTHADDGLRLKGCWVTAALRCPPPENKPEPGERKNCRPYLEAELDLLAEVRLVVPLGRYAYDHVLRILKDRREAVPTPRPEFEHGGEVEVGGRLTVLASYHPSQQNTFTGTLTEEMFDAVWERAREILDSP
ncbi:MAG: uracil-DNA glycosylase [Longimicrobiales bacterium]